MQLFPQRGFFCGGEHAYVTANVLTATEAVERYDALQPFSATLLLCVKAAYTYKTEMRASLHHSAFLVEALEKSDPSTLLAADARLGLYTEVRKGLILQTLHATQKT